MVWMSGHAPKLTAHCLYEYLLALAQVAATVMIFYWYHSCSLDYRRLLPSENLAHLYNNMKSFLVISQLPSTPSEYDTGQYYVALFLTAKIRTAPSLALGILSNTEGNLFFHGRACEGRDF